MNRFFGIVLLFLSTHVLAQNPAIDHLEMLYDQGYYKLVYRKAARLLDKPEYDFSKLPGYYRAMATLQLAQDEHWYKRHSSNIEDALMLLSELRTSSKGQIIIKAHISELSFLKKDLDSWLAIEKQSSSFDKAKWQRFVNQFFADLPLIEVDGNKGNVVVSNRPELKERNELVAIAKKQLGVPYVSAGKDPSGFDCSGFTSFVLQQHGENIPRRASDQFAACVKLVEEEAQIGDLVFFSNGGEVNHVGILINEKGQAKTMIHASSSKGISIVEIENSTYWKPRIVGYGTFIEPKK
ncbi:MAG: C40 family peptidase [Flavobacteriia bacterium]